MSKKLQLRGGTTTEHGSFTGDIREVTVDTDKKTVVVHDNSTAGGFPMARASVLDGLLSGATIPTTIVTAMSANDMDYSAGEYFSKTVTANTTFTFSNISAGYTGWVLEITNGGSFTVTWPSSCKWGGGQAPVLTASGVDILVFSSDDGGVTVRSGIFSTDNKQTGLLL